MWKWSWKGYDIGLLPWMLNHLLFKILRKCRIMHNIIAITIVRSSPHFFKIEATVVHEKLAHTFVFYGTLF
jgi:hypothetical protein